MSTITSEHNEFAPKIGWERHESVAVVWWMILGSRFSQE